MMANSMRLFRLLLSIPFHIIGFVLFTISKYFMITAVLIAGRSN